MNKTHIKCIFLILSTAIIGCGDAPETDINDGSTGDDSGATDSDTDVDTDSDTGTGSSGDSDTDVDTDSDSDSDAECGDVDEPCCVDAPLCQGDLECAGMDDESLFCYEPCVVELCDYSGAQGYCYDVGQTPGTTGVCQGENMTVAECEHGDLNCVTEYGVSTDTVCFEFVSGTYCMELCTPAEVVCDGAHRCVPLVEKEGLGVCIPS